MNTKEELEEALEYMEQMNRLWSWHSIHRNDESEFRNIQDFLKRHGRDYKECKF